MRSPDWFFDYETRAFRGSDDRAFVRIRKGEAFVIMPIGSWDGVDAEHLTPVPIEIANGLTAMHAGASYVEASLGEVLIWASRRASAQAVDYDTGEVYRPQDFQVVDTGKPAVFDRSLVREVLQAFVEAPSKPRTLRCALVAQNGGHALLIGDRHPNGVRSAIMCCAESAKPGDDPLVLG